MIRYLNKAIGREIRVQKKSYLYFGGTSYLGLQTHFRFKRWVLKGVLKYGIHHGASRHANVRISLFNKTEKSLAKQAKAPAALLVSSGYLAGQIVAKQFIGPTYECLYLPNTHTALKLNPAAVETLSDQLSAEISKAIESKKIPVLFFDSIDFFGENFPDFKGLKKLDTSQCILVADDSHALGVVPEDGSGSYDLLSKIPSRKLLVTASLGKGLGISGGVILTDELSAQTLKNSPSFGGASPPNLGGIYAYNQGADIYQKQRDKLHKNVKRFTKGVTLPGFFQKHPGHPAFGFQSPALSKGLEDAGFVLTSFPYPTATDPLMSRIVITASHKKKDIEQLCKAVNTLLNT
ncbi:MAG: pyridoxal phosphate-dependent aminotransferase family protein [Flavobacteriia bacterium]|nr:pyridoxal phosphate-dependent aminotransferase family protein [Flavobacteriia bacterium]